MKGLTCIVVIYLIGCVNSATVNVSDVQNTNSTSTTKGRSLYGLLGFLTGFRLGQGMGPSSYSSDIRESSQLNLFTKLFNGALFFTYSKYPVPINVSPTQYPNGIYPMNLQLPIFYPPLIIPQGHNPINQQQIVNVHEPFNPNEAPNENYQELNDHNSQHIENNFSSTDRIIINETDGKNGIPLIICTGNETCISAIEADYNETLDTDATDEFATYSYENVTEHQLKNVTDVKPTTTQTPIVPNTTQTPPMNATQPTNSSTTGFRPITDSYYPKYPNSINYETISITENPYEMYLKSPDNYEGELPRIDGIIPFATNVIEKYDYRPTYDHFYKPTYDYYKHKYARYNKKIEDSDFKPISNSI